ncbi:MULTISPECIES: hypothetical protein [Nocardia]|uniref:hypothetical protein n=1 Tax=Nocardia TaxID=1817 RepID=UPI00082A0362|nr:MULTISPECIES: hypothetical protein [Nocardia]MBC7300901.1 hypothetical protein [Nocardia sp.]
MMGDEWEDTARDVSQVVLPLLARHRILFIQIGRPARRARTDGTGVGVFEDSRSPQRLYIEGPQPQVGGSLRCSMSTKGRGVPCRTAFRLPIPTWPRRPIDILPTLEL